MDEVGRHGPVSELAVGGGMGSDEVLTAADDPGHEPGLRRPQSRGRDGALQVGDVGVVVADGRRASDVERGQLGGDGAQRIRGEVDRPPRRRTDRPDLLLSPTLQILPPQAIHDAASEAGVMPALRLLGIVGHGNRQVARRVHPNLTLGPRPFRPSKMSRSSPYRRPSSQSLHPSASSLGFT